MALAFQALYRGHRVRQRVVCVAQRDFEIDVGNLDGTSVRDACTWPLKRTACLPTLAQCQQRSAPAVFVDGHANAPQQHHVSRRARHLPAPSACSSGDGADVGLEVRAVVAVAATVTDNPVEAAEATEGVEAAEAAGDDAFLHMSLDAIRDELTWARAALHSREQYLRLAHTSTCESKCRTAEWV